MEETVRRYVEKVGSETHEYAATVDGISRSMTSFESLIIQGLTVVSVEPGRLLCSLKVPSRLLNAGSSLHGGATATLVDVVGSAVILTVGAPTTGVSVEINISYLDAAYLDEEIEIEAKVLRVGKAVGVVSVELRKKINGKIKVVAQGRHTKYLGGVLQEFTHADVCYLGNAAGMQMLYDISFYLDTTYLVPTSARV